MVEVIRNENAKESGKEIVDWTKRSLSLLKKETWFYFFNRAYNWLKSIFWFNNSNENDNDNNKLKKNSTKVEPSKAYRNNTSWPRPFGFNKDNGLENQGNGMNSYTNEYISDSVVKKARDYIVDWWTFYSPSRWTITWGRGKYKHVCSTWSYAVLKQLWIENKSGSNECDLKGRILPKMGFEYIWEVNPDNPGKNWYKPQNWDTAVWPRFNGTQHQATFINWHWVSDTIQRKMSCYNAKNEPMVKVYRYKWKTIA